MTTPDESWRVRHTMEPHATFRQKVRAEELTTEITPTDDVFVLAHFGIPRIALEDWTLHLGGLMKKPMTLRLADLKAFPKVEIESFIKCAGFPHDPTIATRSVSNAVWGGADLGAVLDAAGLDPAARYLWAYGPDHGTYARWTNDRYIKDLALERVRQGGVLLAYELNGEPLTETHGFPLRLFIPGYYGTNNVKWLCRLDAAAERAPGLFTTTLYNDPAPDGGTRPVWEVAPESLIVAPADHATIAAGPLEVWGWCWGAREIATVEVSLDEGKTWRPEQVGPRRQFAWQKFSLACEAAPGPLPVMARATDIAGETQPMQDARNSVHRIKVTVL